MVPPSSFVRATCGEDPLATIDRFGLLLGEAGLQVPAIGLGAEVAAPCSVLDWAESGGMALTGWGSAGPPAVLRAPVMARLRLLGHLLAAATGQAGLPVDVDLAPLLFGRAALLDLGAGGRRSANRMCQLLAAADGWVALNLARPDDQAAVPALVEGPVGADPWEALARYAAATPANEVVERAILLGLPAGRLGERLDDRGRPRRPPFTVTLTAGPRRRPDGTPLRVVDLSGMWAGPLCAHLLGRSGAEVVKVESWDRPDGARSGPRQFYDLLHAGHRSVALDLTTAAGRVDLMDLLRSADVVIEAARPRALHQLGVDGDRLRAELPGLTWVRITGYGAEGRDAQRVAFGDDAAVAGGLVAFDAGGDPVFAGDAMADPVTGMLAATVAAISVAAGGGHLVDVTLAGAAAWVATEAGSWVDHPLDAPAAGGPWVVHHGDRASPAAEPPPWPWPDGAAASLGADNATVLAALAEDAAGGRPGGADRS